MIAQNKSLIAYCGLYCGDCPFHKTEDNIPDLARDLRGILRKYKFESITQEIPLREFKHYKECYQYLGAMVRLRCRRSCRNGGGNPFCKIRKCCQKKGYDGCWECGEFEECKKLKQMRSVHKNALLLNLKNIRKRGVYNFIKGKRYW